MATYPKYRRQAREIERDALAFIEDAAASLGQTLDGAPRDAAFAISHAASAAIHADDHAREVARVLPDLSESGRASAIETAERIMVRKRDRLRECESTFRGTRVGDWPR